MWAGKFSFAIDGDSVVEIAKLHKQHLGMRNKYCDHREMR